jgi:membrane protein
MQAIHSGLVALLGAELNAEIEHVSPYGSAAGERVPGERRAIGALAFERFRKAPAVVAAPRPAAPPCSARRAPSGVLGRAILAVVVAVIAFRTERP